MDKIRNIREIVRLGGIATALIALPAVSFAQMNNSMLEDYDGILKNSKTIEALSPDLFGDQINLYDGSTIFSALDVSVPTNSGLPVSIGRKLSNSGGSFNTWVAQDSPKAVFGRYWILDIPHIRGVYDARTGWVIRDKSYVEDQPETWAGSAQRCSGGTYFPPIVPDNSRDSSALTHEKTYTPRDYWSGNYISIPGVGEERLLNIATSQPRPSNGVTYYGSTKSHWRVSCVSSIKNGAGEGFVVTLPTGVKYTFDWMVSRKSKGVEAKDPEFGSGISRHEIFLYATKAEDRFGNTIMYSYDAENPHRLTSIQSSDGAKISINYNSIGKISSIVSGTRTWTYEYTQQPQDEYWTPEADDQLLTAVVLPDGSRWKYQYSARFSRIHGISDQIWKNCTPDIMTFASNLEPDPEDVKTFTVTHPSGAIGEFKFRKIVHGTNRVPTTCSANPPGIRPPVAQYGDPPIQVVMSLYSKTISGAGLSSQTWSYFYKPTWSREQECPNANDCNLPTETVVTTPSNMTVSYKFDNNYNKNPGELIEEITKDASGVVRKKVTYSYVQSAEAQPFPEISGLLPSQVQPYYVDIPGSRGPLRNRPKSRTEISQDGAVFTESIDSFDAFVRSIRTNNFSSLGYQRVEDAAYYDHNTKWVLGQVKSMTCAAPASCAGQIMSQTDYDTTTALPLKTYAFGKLKQTLTYNTDGTVATVKDGNNNVTTLSNWKRGTPQSIKHPVTPESPSGATESAVVDDNGWIQSVTDETGAKTCYGYDAMGRINLITYPSETQAGVCDTSAWASTSITFDDGYPAVYGMPAGHWRQTTLTGQGRKVTIFDALWRPVVEQSVDLGNTAGTMSEVVKRYDTQGRLVFQSYPMNTNGQANYADTTLKGTTTSYDALDRPTTVKQDSELGVLTTTTEYLSGFQTRVTNPRGQKTTTSYMAWDQPTTDYPVAIDQPKGVRTTIPRDAYGKPLQVTRSGPDQ